MAFISIEDVPKKPNAWPGWTWAVNNDILVASAEEADVLWCKKRGCEYGGSGQITELVSHLYVFDIKRQPLLGHLDSFIDQQQARLGGTELVESSCAVRYLAVWFANAGERRGGAFWVFGWLLRQLVDPVTLSLLSKSHDINNLTTTQLSITKQTFNQAAGQQQHINIHPQFGNPPIV
jgi:hypothetical protein